jgi:hypothetical protein
MIYDKNFELRAYKTVLEKLEHPNTKRLFICESLEDFLIDKGYTPSFAFDRKQEVFQEFFASKPNIYINDNWPWWNEDDKISRIVHMKNLIKKMEDEKGETK